jgi:hypothetical protein
VVEEGAGLWLLSGEAAMEDWKSRSASHVCISDMARIFRFCGQKTRKWYCAISSVCGEYKSRTCESGVANSLHDRQQNQCPSIFTYTKREFSLQEGRKEGG